MRLVKGDIQRVQLNPNRTRVIKWYGKNQKNLVGTRDT